MKKLIPLILIVLVCACHENKPVKVDNGEPNNSQLSTLNSPLFNADSAYAFVKAQTDFGPRVPGTEAHELCAAWLVEQLSEYADTVIVQKFRTRLYNNKGIDGKNIIASFNPKAAKRIVLCAHWDSRPFADHDPDEANWNRPIDGANDGASGVGVLIEAARCFYLQPLNEKTGVDIILFDLEDFGPRQDQAELYYDNGRNHWALGSQYWAATPHVRNYNALFGVLLDMVGGPNPHFMKEFYSVNYASSLSHEAWTYAQSLGYGSFFVDNLGDPISDDHLPLNEIAGIPTIDIIDLQPNSSNGCFPETWHTLNDNFHNIDKNTLEMVGKVVIFLVYQK